MPNGKKQPQIRKQLVPPGTRVGITIRPEDVEQFECSVCGSRVFARAVSVGRVSAIQSPTGKETVGDTDAGYLCGGCGGHNTHVPSKEVEKQKEKVKSALTFGAEGSGYSRERPTDQPDVEIKDGLADEMPGKTEDDS